MGQFQSSGLKGVFPALFTPLKKDDSSNLRNSIDYEKAGLMIDDLIQAGVHGIVPVGTTGQSATLSHAQHLDMIRFTIERVDGKIPVLAGAGSNCTRESVDMIQAIQKIAEVPVLCVTGYYNNPPIEGSLNHYKALSAETGASIVLYNVPGRTASYMNPDAILELAQDPNIIGLKQAVNFKPDGEFHKDTADIISGSQNLGFSIVSGEDDSLAQILKMGGHGIITATGNIPEAAKVYVEIYNAAQKGDYDKADALQNSLALFVKACFIRKNPIPLGSFFNSPLYLPLVSVIETKNGNEALQLITDLINTKAQSLKKYF
jgi:4-hydroxy-tetrahydrodipicolinate synthase